MNYPTLEEVRSADRKQICNWYRHLGTFKTDEELEVLKLINQRFKELGGFTPEISKAIGWKP